MTKLEQVTKTVVERLSRERGGNRVGIREVALAVEKEMGQETDIAAIHAAVNEVAAFYPSDDPQDQDVARQFPFGWDIDGDPRNRRVWIWAV